MDGRGQSATGNKIQQVIKLLQIYCDRGKKSTSQKCREDLHSTIEAWVWSIEVQYCKVVRNPLKPRPEIW